MIEWTPMRDYLPCGVYRVLVVGFQKRRLCTPDRDRPLVILTVSVQEGRNWSLPWSPKRTRFRIILDSDDHDMMEVIAWATGQPTAFDKKTRKLLGGLLHGWQFAAHVETRESVGGYSIRLAGVEQIEQSVLASRD